MQNKKYKIQKEKYKRKNTKGKIQKAKCKMHRTKYSIRLVHFLLLHSTSPFCYPIQLAPFSYLIELFPFFIPLNTLELVGQRWIEAEGWQAGRFEAVFQQKASPVNSSCLTIKLPVNQMAPFQPILINQCTTNKTSQTKPNNLTLWQWDSTKSTMMDEPNKIRRTHQLIVSKKVNRANLFNQSIKNVSDMTARKLFNLNHS